MIDRAAALALCDEADAERARVTPWDVRIYCAESMDIDKSATAWAANAHEREGQLTAQVRELVAQIRDYERAITWSTTCTNCAKLIDTNYDQYQQLAEARARIAELERGKDESSTV